MDQNNLKNVKEVEVTAKQIVDRLSRNSLSSETVNDKLDGLQLTEKLTELAASNLKEAGENVPVDSSEYPESIRVSSHTVPEPFQLKSQQLLGVVQSWVKDPENSILNDIGNMRISLDSFHWIFSIESYLRTLEPASQINISATIETQLVAWLKTLFHFRDGIEGEDYNSVVAHWDPLSGVVPLTQLVLINSFPDLLTNTKGSEACKTPIMYCSDKGIGIQMATKLGLSFTSVSVIDVTDDSWVPLLEQRIISDSKKDLAPFLFVLDIGMKHIENVCRLAESYNIRIHFYGPNAIPYFIARPEGDQIGQSLTLDFSKWIRSPTLPFLTLYKKLPKTDNFLLEFCGLQNPYSRLSAFSPWFILKSIGVEDKKYLVQEMTRHGQFFFSLISRYECLKIVPGWGELSDGTVILSSITFQYNPPNMKNSSTMEIKTPEESDVEIKEVPKSTTYADTLNSWLYHIMERDMKEYLELNFYSDSPKGSRLCIDVMKNVKKLSADDEKAIVLLFKNHMGVLQATVAQKVPFAKLVNEAEELEWIDHEALWAGLGAVRYIPHLSRGTGSLEKEKALKENVDHLNAKIVDKLKAFDSAFSLGESTNGDWCVQFGMVTMDTNVAELVRVVVSSGQEIEESSEFFHRMSELVKKGIETATEELKKETEEALWEEGILRHVPVVGTFVKWFSPPAKESGVRGRALNLTQGKVESTENIYKYHMQMQVDTSISVTNLNEPKEDPSVP